MRALGVTTERAVMTRLISAMRGDRKIFEDATRMFYQCYDNLPQAVINHAVRECFTEDVHDELANFAPNILRDHTYRKNIEFDYTLDEKSLEDTVSGFNFVLPKTSNELYNFGYIMHNCVGSYIDNMLRKRCLIVAVVNEKGKGVACLELRHRNIAQAKAPCNKEIDIDLQLVIFKWMKWHGIASDTRDLMTDKLVQAMFWRQCA